MARIVAGGLPVPPKSACWLCIANRPEEIRELPRWCLRLIVLVEARAAPRLHTVEGLWRRSTKARPGRMTDFIRAEGLLPSREIDRIWRDAPRDLIRFQDGMAIAKAAGCFVGAMLASAILVRPVLDLVARSRSEEVFTAVALLIALSAGWLTGSLGLSVTLGAFLGGAMIADSPYRSIIQSEARPFRGLLRSLQALVDLGLDAVRLGDTLQLLR